MQQRNYFLPQGQQQQAGNTAHRAGGAHLLAALHEVHEAVVVVVVVGAARRVDGQQQVVAAQAVALRVLVGEDAGLQQLVVAVVDACSERAGGRTEGGRC